MSEPLDLDAVEQLIRDRHSVPLDTIATALTVAVTELRNARTTISEDLEYQRKIELTLAKTLSRLANYEPLEARG